MPMRKNKKSLIMNQKKNKLNSSLTGRF